MQTLDISSLPTSYHYDGDQFVFSMDGLIDKIKATVEFFAQQGIVQQTNSLGYAIVIDDKPNSDPENLRKKWDDPAGYISFVGGWGPEKDALIANAVRKLRFAVRTEEESLVLIHASESFISNEGIDTTDGDIPSIDTPVESVESDGTFAWGDFPYGGATWVPFGLYYHVVSVSGLQQDEDDLVAGFIGKLVGLFLDRSEPATNAQPS